MSQEDKKSSISTVFQALDGTIFATRAEAAAHNAKPKVLAALNSICANDSALANWLFETREAISNAFDTGVIRRVTKAEHKALLADLTKLKENAEAAKAQTKVFGYPFLAEYSDAILASFKHLTSTRLKPEERDLAIKNTFLKLTNNNEATANWVITNKDAILAAYDAGVEKREVNPKALDALAEYRARKAAEKAAKAAGVPLAATEETANEELDLLNDEEIDGLDEAEEGHESDESVEGLK